MARPPLGPVLDLPPMVLSPAEALRAYDRVATRHDVAPEVAAAAVRVRGNPLTVARAWGCQPGLEAAWIVAFFEANTTMEVLL